MTIEASDWCAVCDTHKPLAELLRVTNVRSGAVHYVCRPNQLGQCFRRGVASVYIHRIGRADQ